MIFSVQRYLEDYFHRRNLVDNDQYAVKLANLYGHHRASVDRDALLMRMRRVRTIFFRLNPGVSRPDFERRLLDLLDRRFPKGGNPTPLQAFPGGTTLERRRLQRQPRRSIAAILAQFKHAVEARGVDSFWLSRTKDKLRPKPETIAQALLAVFIKGTLQGRGIVLREVGSGVGYVDVQVILSRSPHLIELKMLKGRLEGASQLAEYMRLEGRSEGWLVLIDVRPPQNRRPLPATMTADSGTVRVLSVDVNPTPPSGKRATR